MKNALYEDQGSLACPAGSRRRAARNVARSWIMVILIGVTGLGATATIDTALAQASVERTFRPAAPNCSTRNWPEVTCDACPMVAGEARIGRWPDSGTSLGACGAAPNLNAHDRPDATIRYTYDEAWVMSLREVLPQRALAVDQPPSTPASTLPAGGGALSFLVWSAAISLLLTTGVALVRGLDQ